ncbi:bifunctional 4-hydroxy-2-oxoglutarate aldolase/2-dehydro-3-deoxy-phosphogluconate aldolase, partial [Mesorhizobium tamadayense]
MASLEACRRSGAKFGLSPGFDPAIVDAAKAAGLPFAPGVMTPTDVTLAAAKGLGLVKFFPAAMAGGPTALEGISAPFAHLSMRFIPTGGVSLATIGDWLKLKSVAAVGGTW